MKVYTVAEVAEILKISEATVRKLIRDEKLPVIKLGTAWRVPADELDDFVKKNTDGPRKSADTPAP